MKSMTDKEKQQNYLDTAKFFLLTLRYAIFEDKKMPKKPDNVRWEDLFILSQRHSVIPIVFQYIMKIKDEIEPNLFLKWKNENDLYVFVDTEQNFAWDEIKNYFSQKEIPILPVKGILLKSIYPQTYLRTMGDLDILFKREFREKIHESLSELGYKYDGSHSDTTVDFYHRPTNSNIEAHYSLMPKSAPFKDYYVDIWEKALATETPFLYRLSREDEYLFLLIHAAKHFFSGGTGVRTIVDLYLFNKKYHDALDREYIKKELEKVSEIAKKSGPQEYSLIEFEKIVKKLMDQWFNNEIILDNTGLKIITDGVYGRSENLWVKRLKEMGRKRYLLYRLFPPLDELKKKYTILKRIPFLLPVFWIWRLITGPIKRRKRIVYELKIIKNSSLKQ